MADRTNPERLRELALAARGTGMWIDAGLISAILDEEDGPLFDPEDGPFIAAASPDVILALLDRADRAEARVAALTEAVEGLRKDHGAQNRLGIIGPDGHAGAWAALGAVLGFLEGKPIAPPPFDYEDYARRRAAEYTRLATPEAPEPPDYTAIADAAFEEYRADLEAPEPRSET